MFVELAFILGLVHNLLLICIFYSRGIKNENLLRKFGLAYLILIIPLAIISLILSIFEGKESWNTAYLAVVLVYLGFEVLLDWVLKKEFRSNWKVLIPYLALYFFANYALVMIVWKSNLTLGIILLALYIIQLIVNIFSHNKINIFLHKKKQ
jgi:hypothetical protein